MNNKINKINKGKPYYYIRNNKQLEDLYILSINDACNFLGIGRTFFKKECRRIGISEWPNLKKIPITNDVILALVLLMLYHDS